MTPRKHTKLRAADVQRTLLARIRGVLSAFSGGRALTETPSAAICRAVTTVAGCSTACPVGAGCSGTARVIISPCQAGVGKENRIICEARVFCLCVSSRDHIGCWADASAVVPVQGEKQDGCNRRQEPGKAGAWWFPRGSLRHGR